MDALRDRDLARSFVEATREMTQDEAAELLGAGQKTLSNWRAGRYPQKLSREWRGKIQQFLGSGVRAEPISGLLILLDRESRAAESRARAAILEAEAAKERAVAARLAEENARDLRRDAFSSEELAAKMRQGLDTLDVARGTTPAQGSPPPPEPSRESRPAAEQE